MATGKIVDPTNSFDWALIKSFLAVMDSGTLMGAARRLKTTQPTVGRHIEALESQLGVNLFERSGRGLTPTGGASLIAEQARQMQAGAEGLARAIAGQDTKSAGLVRIAASRMVSLHWLPVIVGQIQAELDNIDITIVASDEVSNLLRRDADIAIRMVQPQQNTLIARKIGELPIVPCASRQYLARWGRPRQLQDLLAHRLIGPESDESFLQAIKKMETVFGVAPGSIRHSCRSDDYAVQFACIKAGLGVGFANQNVVVSDPDIERLPFDVPAAPLPVWLAVHREIRTSPRIRRVFDLLAEKLKEAL
ncbi:MAG: LysR family transcriptional regulator [Burkholderiaceae bacterium]